MEALRTGIPILFSHRYRQYSLFCLLLSDFSASCYFQRAHSIPNLDANLIVRWLLKREIWSIFFFFVTLPFFQR